MHNKIFRFIVFLCFPEKVLVIIDAKPKDLGLPTEAYIAVEEVHDVSTSISFSSLCALKLAEWSTFSSMLKLTSKLLQKPVSMGCLYIHYQIRNFHRN